MYRNMIRLLVFVVMLMPLARLSAAVAVPAPPSMAASAYFLQDFHSGYVIAESGADQPVEPASITKVMTAYIVFDLIKAGNLDMQDKTTISVKAWRNPEFPEWMDTSRMFAEVDSQVSIEELLRGLIVQSGNDAAVALAEHIAGSEDAFVVMMNQRAQALGMNNTNYRNSSGLPQAEHYTTARDTAILARALIQDFPELYKIFAERGYQYNNISQNNRNTLLWKDSSVDGIKTGHTESAGFCLVASAMRDGMRLISVVMGTQNDRARTSYSQKLLNYGYRFFETHKLFTADNVLREVRVWGGSEDTLKLGLMNDMYITIPRGQYESLKASMDVQAEIDAPIVLHDQLGKVRVNLSGEEIYSMPLIALNEIPRGNFFQRMSDQVVRMFE